jgi:ABC-type methionine transport system permease subunit
MPQQVMFVMLLVQIYELTFILVGRDLGLFRLSSELAISQAIFHSKDC